MFSEVKNRPNTQSEVPCQYPCQEENTSPKLNDERTQCTKEMDENAGQTSSKAYVNNVGLHGSQGDINSPNEGIDKIILSTVLQKQFLGPGAKFSVGSFPPLPPR